MDPDENLKQQLWLAKCLAENPKDEAFAYQLSELVIAMNDWIANGGFLPKKWSR